MIILTVSAASIVSDKKNLHLTQKSPKLKENDVETNEWELTFKNLTIHGYHYITTIVAPSNYKACLREKRPMRLYCITSSTIPTEKGTFDRYNDKDFKCYDIFYNVSSMSYSPMFFACAIRVTAYHDGSYGEEVIQLKYIDLFKELTGVPHWAIWSGIALESLFVVCSCWCCCCKSNQ